MTAPTPEERFDLYSRDGMPLGRSKARREVHRDGDWHRSLHIWVWGVLDGAPHVVLQRRSLAKDTSPGALDVAVTGHARAGETVEDTLREAEEEIGLVVRVGDLCRLGLRRRSVSRYLLQDNELQDIFAHRAAVDLTSLRADPAEVTAILALPLATAPGVLCEGASARARRLVPADVADEMVSTAEMVPAPDGYYRRALASLVRVVRGEAAPPWEIG